MNTATMFWVGGFRSALILRGHCVHITEAVIADSKYGNWYDAHDPYLYIVIIISLWSTEH